jgi:hypothetical protein
MSIRVPDAIDAHEDAAANFDAAARVRLQFPADRARGTFE